MEEHGEEIALRDSRIPQADYTYRPLYHHREIRLLSYQYLPDENEVTIQGNLTTKSLDQIVSSEIKFWALSYAWGDPNDTVAIKCDGKCLSITRNLHALLVNLFKMTELEKPESGYVWADAICIDQGDNDEKTLQVRLMQEIYSHADHVVAWLGEESESVKRGFACFRRLYATMNQYTFVNPETQRECFDYRKLDVNEAEALTSAILGRTDKVWADIVFLLSMPWFSRVWVVQEALMAKTLTFLCGTTTLPAEIILPVADVLTSMDICKHMMLAHLPSLCFLNASYLGQMRSSREGGDTMKIYDILLRTRGFQASDARDKVFAIVGLAADIDDTFIDYQISPRSMLVRLAKHLLNIPTGGATSYPRLEMLGYAGFLQTTKDVPSWVADWTLSKNLPTPFWMVFGRDHDNNLRSLETERTCQFAQVTDDKSLLLHGRLLDRVENTVDLDSITIVMALAPQAIRLDWKLRGLPELSVKKIFLSFFERSIDPIRMMQQLVDDLGTYPTGETLTDVLWRSVLLDDECEKGLEYGGQWAKLCSMLRQCVDLCHTAKEEEAPNLWQQAQEIRRTYSEILDFVDKSLPSECFSATKRGYVGWMPEKARKDDELWVFNGCPVPFVLRPANDRQEDERAYRLVGDCYLHGLMRPEASARIAGETQQIKLV